MWILALLRVRLCEKKYTDIYRYFFLTQWQMICLNFSVNKDCGILLLLKSQNSKISIFSHAKYAQEPQRREGTMYGMVHNNNTQNSIKKGDISFDCVQLDNLNFVEKNE